MEPNLNQNQVNIRDQVDDLVRDFGNNFKTSGDNEDVIYGVYDNSDKSIFARINDWFVDRSKISLREKAYFFYLMAIMLDAGLSVVQVLKILARRTDNRKFNRVLNTLAYSIERGTSLSKAMERFPNVFSESETSTVRSGEMIGHLDKMLFKLSNQTGRNYEFSLKVVSSLFYPVTVFIALILAGAVLMFYVVPQLTEVFDQSGNELPDLTKIFIGLSGFLISFWWLFLVLILIFFVGFSFYIQTDIGKLKWDYYKLKLPLAGDLIKKFTLVNFVNLLEILIAAGLSITKVLDIAIRATDNEVYKRKLIMVKNSVEKGEKFADSLSDAPFLFPEDLVQMLSIGEQSATLDRSADKLARHYQQEVEHGIKRLTSVFEPLVIVLIGLLVAFVGFAILEPVFSLSQIAAGS